ncbi:MAG: CHAT domain-containing protein [Cocleimonas sp.]|nr:CHAT domain-containing protein [Cocleimonas sp.]
MKINSGEWFHAALDLESLCFVDLIKSLPTTNALAIALAQEKILESRINALMIISRYGLAGDNLKQAIVLSTMGSRLCEHCYKLYGAGMSNTFVFARGAFAYDAQYAYKNSNQYKKQLLVIENTLEWLNASETKEIQVIQDMKMARIDALIELGLFEKAEKILTETRLAFETEKTTTAHTMYTIKSSLPQRIKAGLLSVTTVDNIDTEKRKNVAKQKQSSRLATDELNIVILGLKNFLLQFEDEKEKKLTSYPSKTLAPVANHFLNLKEKLIALKTKMTQPIERLPSDKFIGHNHDLYTQANDVFKSITGNQFNSNQQQISLNFTIQQVSVVLAQPEPAQGYNLSVLNHAKKSLENIREKALNANLDDTAKSTLWPLYLCFKRLKQYDKAFNSLQLIRQWVKAQRSLITDPFKRGGIAKQYPYLYLELCFILTHFKGNRNAELLEVIEEGKGRLLTDTLAIKAKQDKLPHTPTASLINWLPKEMVKLNSHYVTFLVDNKVSYAVCVSKHGKLYSACIPLGSDLLGELEEDIIDPQMWGKKINARFTAPNDVPQQLNPLVDWLAELVDSGILEKGDHICYSPDALLHLVPLHYVDFRGEPFVKWVSLSCVHSATLLYSFSQQTNDLRPADYVALNVPRKKERIDQLDKVKQLQKVGSWLTNSTLTGVRLKHEQADLTALATQKLTHSIIHFATHGYFDEVDPFRKSGLLLSSDGQLPDGAKSSGRLSPERIIESNSLFNFNGSHVSLQACVSGHSKEGVAGDALGLEWSLLIAGAQSILSTHWYVSAESSATFCIDFYQEWLVNGLTRAQAWRSAVLHQMDHDKPFKGKNAYCWAAFSLAGDWR